MRARKLILGVVGTVVGLVLLLVIAGLMLPRDHVATSAVSLRQPPESVWLAVRDLGGVPAWWSEVTSAERVPDAAGRESWRQTVSGFAMTFIVQTDEPPRRLVTAIDTTGGAAFGGTWTYQLAPEETGTRVTVTEAGWIANPLFRAMSAIMGQHGTLDGYLVALGRRFGEAVTPEHVER